MQIVSAEQVQVLHAQVEAEAADGRFFIVSCDVGGEGEILD
jgi:hypothetical protein